MKCLHDDAVLGDAAEVRKLSGLSGAQVFLVSRDSRHWFVRKAARNPAASARLQRQADKQRAFAERADGVVRTPAILDEGEIDGRYYFDMEWIRGQDGTSFLRQASYRQVVALADRLCAYLDVAAAAPPVCKADRGGLFDALFAKLHEVQATTGLIAVDNLARLFMSLDRVRRLGELAPTLCHGDLTLANMVVDHDGSVWVVDLLDAPFEHYWQDVAKLHQDLAGGWFLLEQPPVAQCVLDYLSRRLLDATAALDPGYHKLHDLLVASTFVRILPYARTDRERQFVTERIDFFAARAERAR